MFVRLRRRVDSKKMGVCLDPFPSERQYLSLVVSDEEQIADVVTMTRCLVIE
jgi:hypothetical protein